jgi:flagellar basal-body rod protein FlgC
MDFFKSLTIAASGLKAQSGRMRVIAENIANADSTPTKPGEAPYRRKIVTFQRVYDSVLDAQVVKLGRIATDHAQFGTRFEPGNPAADARGNVQTPNVSSVIETMDMREAQRTYEANLNVVTATRRMISRTLDILKA